MNALKAMQGPARRQAAAAIMVKPEYQAIEQWLRKYDAGDTAALAGRWVQGIVGALGPIGAIWAFADARKQQEMLPAMAEEFRKLTTEVQAASASPVAAAG